MQKSCELLDKQLRWDCMLETLKNSTKDFDYFVSPAGEWLLIGVITLFVVAQLIYIFNGFLDD